MHSITRESRDQGFTLMELLVVMIVIAILASIAIPIFISTRSRAATTSLKSDLRNLGTVINGYYLENTNGIVVDTTGRPGYIGIWGADLSYYEKLSPNTHASYPTYTAPGGPTTWCVALANDNASPQTWRFTAMNGLEPGLCSF